MCADEATQAHVKFPSLAAWSEGFLLPMYQTCFECLVAGCVALINITSTPSDSVLKSLEAENMKVAMRVGFEYVEQIVMSGQQSQGFEPLMPPQKLPSTAMKLGKGEKMFVFRRPLPHCKEDA